VRDEMAQFHNAGVQPFGVNPAGIDSHKKYAEKMKFNFPLLSDPERRIAGAYGAVKPDGQGIQRSVVLIGKDGKVLFAARGAPGADEVLASVGV
jgi:peroxiredoxin Q/BCP